MKRIVKAVAIITIFAVLTRALGFVIRIYMSRKLGAELLGVYQVAISVFGVFCTMISSGIPLMISRSVSIAQAQQDKKRQYRIVSSGLLLSITIATALSSIIFLFPSSLNFIFTSNKSTKILLWLLPGIIASAVYTTFRGALWGQKRFFWISCSEFFEQLIRIIFIVVLFEALPIAEGGELAAISLSIACILSALLVTILYFAYGGKLANPTTQLIPLLKSSTPVTAIRTASSLGSFAIAIIMPLRLVASGLTEARAMSLFGIASGMALPLIMIPSTLIGSLATAIVPDISEIVDNPKTIATNPKFKIVKSKINTSINITLIIGFLFIPSFLMLGPQIGSFLFASKEAGVYVSHAAFLMIPMGLSHLSSSLLNAIGLENRSLYNYIIGSILLFSSIFFLPPIIGIYALLVGMGLMFTITSILNLSMLKKYNLLSNSHLKTSLFLFLYCIPSAFAAKYTYILFNIFCPSAVALIISGILSVGIYLFFCMLFHQFDIKIIFSNHKNKKKV